MSSVVVGSQGDDYLYVFVVHLRVLQRGRISRCATSTMMSVTVPGSRTMADQSGAAGAGLALRRRNRARAAGSNLTRKWALRLSSRLATTWP